MRSLVRAVVAALASATVVVAAAVPAHAVTAPSSVPVGIQANATSNAEAELRVATFNASLYRSTEGRLAADLSGGRNAQAKAVAEIIQRSAPDVLLINEFDFDAAGRSAETFRDQYLGVSQNGQAAQDYPYIYTAPSNTGVQTGADLNQDGAVGGPDDAFGYGAFEGQYGMVLYSKYPIQTQNVRTFQNFRWADMPENLLPHDYYGELVSNVLRLSSKSHWDVPVTVDGTTVHVLAAHPTPPTFDGEEQRNARRNHDEIRFISDYVTGGEAASYIYDDAGVTGGLAAGSKFVILGDLNADPYRGDSFDAAAQQVLQNPLITDPKPRSKGGEQAGRRGLDYYLRAPGSAGGADAHTRALSTADFGGSTGTLRVDYALPSATLQVEGAGVFWPAANEPGAELVGMDPTVSSDHRLVWVDVEP